MIVPAALEWHDQRADHLLKLCLRAAEPLFGLWLSLGSPTAAEGLARTGFDWLGIDMEHASNDTRCDQAVARNRRRTFADRGYRAGTVERRLARQASARCRCARWAARPPMVRDAGFNGIALAAALSWMVRAARDALQAVRR